jgi:hypothetical protein
VRKEYDESDDGRVVADMTGVERRRVMMPKRPTGTRGELQNNVPDTMSSGSMYQEEVTPEQRRWYILGALKAALMIGAVYAVGFGLAILLLLLIWNH